MDKALVAATIGLMILALVAAAVFTYYPLTLAVQPAGPKVVFDYGSNANQPDIYDEIGVSIGSNKTYASITIHPTYQVTYYKNITLIKNTDTKAYNVYLVINNSAGGLPADSKVVLYIYKQGATRNLAGWPAASLEPKTGTYVAYINLAATSLDSPVQIGQLAGGSTWEVDILVYIPEGNYAVETYSQTFSMHIVYTPGSETPP